MVGSATNATYVPGKGGLRALVDVGLSNILWWHLGRNIAASARELKLPSNSLQDLDARMHQR
jgi:hypothetical protein